MSKAILIHGWEGTPQDEWFPWVGKELAAKGWEVITPAMPHTKNPKLSEWMEVLESLSPDKDTLLVGHSLANSLILHYLEKSNVKIKGAVMVAAWDWLMEDVKEFHKTFFAAPFNYNAILEKQIPLFIVNSTTDPWIDLERSKPLAKKIGADFITMKDAGHFMARDGYTKFPQLVEIIEENFASKTSYD
jgi:hypothetical protein